MFGILSDKAPDPTRALLEKLAMRLDGTDVTHAFEFSGLSNGPFEDLPTGFGDWEIWQHVGKNQGRSLLITEIVGATL